MNENNENTEREKKSNVFKTMKYISLMYYLFYRIKTLKECCCNLIHKQISTHLHPFYE